MKGTINKIFFFSYLIILIFFVLFKFTFTLDDLIANINHFRTTDYKRVNLDFLSSIKMQVNILDRWAIVNLLANTIPFVLFGFLFSNVFKIRIFIKIVYSLILVLSLELIQLIFVIGTFDIDDIFLNIISIILGLSFGTFVFKNKLDIFKQ